MPTIGIKVVWHWACKHAQSIYFLLTQIIPPIVVFMGLWGNTSISGSLLLIPAYCSIFRVPYLLFKQRYLLLLRPTLFIALGLVHLLAFSTAKHHSRELLHDLAVKQESQCNQQHICKAADPRWQAISDLPNHYKMYSEGAYQFKILLIIGNCDEKRCTPIKGTINMESRTPKTFTVIRKLEDFDIAMTGGVDQPLSGDQ